jgi:hypothetical protein
VARINADLIPDIVVGAGVNGGSLVDVWAWSNTTSATLSSLSANGIGFAAFTDASRNAPVQVAALDTTGDGIADVILAVQGPGGTTGQIRAFNITSVSPLQVSPPTAVPGSFFYPYFIATITNPSPVLPLVGSVNNDPPPTKFYVVNDGSPDRTYEYGASGTATQNYALGSADTAPRGAVSTVAGDKVWVVDANRKVYVYNASGSLLGSWTAGTLASNATVEGIATNGTDIWIVDAKSDKVFKYANAAGRLSGSQNAASSFNLNSGNTSPMDIVTGGTNLWVVNDASQDKVFKYTLSGSLVGSWTITGGGGAPTGITLDPAAPSDLWIVDNNTDRVYQYSNAVSLTSGSLAASSSFALAAGNTNPQGIADPPPSRGATEALTQDAALPAVATSFALAAGNTNPQGIADPPPSRGATEALTQDAALPAVATSFALAAGNTNPQGIVDPPPPSSGATEALTQDAALPAAATGFAPAAGNTNPQGIADPPPPSRGAAKAVTQDAALLAFLGELDEMDWLTPGHHKWRR